LHSIRKFLTIVYTSTQNITQPYHKKPLTGVISMSRFISTAICALFVGSICTSVASASDLAAGKALYETSCTACHKSGLLGAPKLGDKAAWAPRIAQGIDVLVSHADKGFSGKKGTMPAKGGNAKLTTEEIGNAVAYLAEQGK
jgi:cytochrome c5